MKASAIILYNKNKKILLQHRSDDAPNAPGKWGFFGGGIKNNETPKEAVVRECYEELNYKLKNPKLILEKRINFILKQYVFIEEYDEVQNLILNEGKEMRWFKIDEANDIQNIIHITQKPPHQKGDQNICANQFINFIH